MREVQVPRGKKTLKVCLAKIDVSGDGDDVDTDDAGVVVVAGGKE